MIKNIIFDLGGVILDLDRSRVIEAYNAMGFTEADELLNNFLQKGVFMRLEMGTADRWELYDYVRTQAGSDIPVWKIDDALNNFIVGLAPYKLRMLERLGRDYRLFVLSNTNAVMIPEIDRIWFSQAGKRMGDYFERTFLSHEMNMLKPDQGIFRHVAAEAGIVPAETLFLDDGLQNVKTAADCGFAVYRPAPGEDLRQALTAELGLPAGYFDD